MGFLVKKDCLRFFLSQYMCMSVKNTKLKKPNNKFISLLDQKDLLVDLLS